MNYQCEMRILVIFPPVLRYIYKKPTFISQCLATTSVGQHTVHGKITGRESDPLARVEGWARATMLISLGILPG